MKEQAAASVQAEELLPVGYNRRERFAHVQQLVASITVVHLRVLLPVFRQVRLQEVAVHVRVQVTATPHLQEARVHILLRQEVAAVAVAVDRSVAEAAAVAAVQVAAAVAAVVQVDADNERDNIIIV